MQNLHASGGHTGPYKQTAVTGGRIFFSAEDTGAAFLYLLDQPINPPGKIILVPDAVIGY
jgi:hypothetical protein